jgi:hypothetical protein
VNKGGARFVDENAESDPLAHSIAHQTDFLVWLVWDDKLATENSQVLDEYLDRAIKASAVPVTREQLMWKADTVYGLAKKIDVPPERLKKTLEEYNAAVKQDGTAPRIPYPKAKNAVRIDKPPFYAHPVTCALNQSLGGIVTNTKMQVIDTEDQAIPGLYACGSTTWYHYGKEWVDSEGRAHVKTSYGLPAGLGHAMCTGYFAGESAAASAKS